MRVFRVAYRMFAATPLDGQGSFLFGGRWSNAGTYMAYTSSTVSLAMLEFLAHIDIDEDVDPESPPELVYVAATVADEDVSTLDALSIALPPRWNSVPATSAAAALGDAWIADGRSLGLIVPSIHVPANAPEHNVLLNPQHPRFETIVWTTANLTYDRRLLSARVKAKQT